MTCLNIVLTLPKVTRIICHPLYQIKKSHEICQNSVIDFVENFHFWVWPRKWHIITIHYGPRNLHFYKYEYFLSFQTYTIETAWVTIHPYNTSHNWVIIYSWNLLTKHTLHNQAAMKDDDLFIRCGSSDRNRPLSIVTVSLMVKYMVSTYWGHSVVKLCTAPSCSCNITTGNYYCTGLQLWLLEWDRRKPGPRLGCHGNYKWAWRQIQLMTSSLTYLKSS